MNGIAKALFYSVVCFIGIMVFSFFYSAGGFEALGLEFFTLGGIGLTFLFIVSNVSQEV